MSYQTVLLQGIRDSSSAQIEPCLAEAAGKFLASNPDEQQARQWLHEARDYMVRYSWSSSFWIIAIGGFVGEGRSFPPPPEEDDFSAWRARWGC